MSLKFVADLLESMKSKSCNFVCIFCREFGDYYTKAVEETWYKAAVMQHKIDSESFVYSVPHDDKDDNKEIGEIKVTASHAIFRVDGVHEAPASVVGFQFEQRKMMERFKNITAKDNVISCQV